MSAQHTQGRLTASQYLDDGRYGILSSDNEILVGVSSKLTEADARRLAACWNACEGLTVENLEDNMPLLDGLTGLNTKLAENGAALFAARALLVDVLSTSTRSSINADLTERIRAHLKGQP